MGFGGISIWSLLLILAIVILLFGTKKLKNVGGDLGGAIRSFKKAVKDEDAKANVTEQTGGQVIDAKVTTESKEKSS